MPALPWHPNRHTSPPKGLQNTRYVTSDGVKDIKPERKVNLSSHSVVGEYNERTEDFDKTWKKKPKRFTDNTVLTFQDAVDRSLQSRVCVRMRKWCELRGVMGLLGGRVVGHLGRRLPSWRCCKRWAVTLRISVGSSAAAVAGGPVVLLRSLQSKDYPAFYLWRREFICCTRAYSPAPTWVFVPSLRVCPIWWFCRTSVWLTETTVGQWLRGGGILEKFGFRATTEVFQEAVCEAEEGMFKKTWRQANAITLLFLFIPGSTSTMRLSCVRLLRSSWLNVLSIITISDDGLECCRERKTVGAYVCRNICINSTSCSCVPTSASTISSRLYLLTIAWVLFSTWLAMTSNSSSTAQKENTWNWLYETLCACRNTYYVCRNTGKTSYITSVRGLGQSFQGRTLTELILPRRPPLKNVVREESS